ncbi:MULTISPECIES: UPF0223 family protein [unclassified Granulicatella]|uniref:UPF0223 family protein n=1 Tax=unclassified Granulicatella TaxID=2630493 RepID=UPI00107433DB|nr:MULTISPECIES: UPF0223 family protein [unclassified Granulicatella]MBF0780319.1 UPF0223 family protein [Granulicatella sp. 19428wC4_WM01]TFU95546.1 UPF0223 family protein [Granulicatella sp. WM01]
MTKNYEYPLDYTWTRQEMIDVIALWNAVEKAYETGVKKDEFLNAYKRFKEIVPSKSEEKHLAHLFEKCSGYVLYAVWKQANSEQKIIKMESCYDRKITR